MVAGVSDGLQAPLAAVASATAALRVGLDPANAGQGLEIIVRHVQRLQRALGEVVEWPRLVGREFRLRPELQDLEARVSRVLADASPVSPRIRLRREIPGGLGGILADREALDHVLHHLVATALAGCGDEAVILVRASAEGRWVRIAVESDGRPGNLAPMIHRLVEAMGGRVAGDDRAGLTVLLPRA
jgi:signal transduction histidine kinase